MAIPDYYYGVKAFNYSIKTAVNNFLPLMQFNDVFIVSAIITNLLDHVVWVVPTWERHSNDTNYFHAYVGVTKWNTTLLACVCEKPIYDEGEGDYTCFVTSREINEIDEELPQKRCHMFKSYTYVIINEIEFLTRLSLHNYNNIILDIDEDFFGVESGEQNFIDKGVSTNTSHLMDEYFPLIFCPSTNKEEEFLNNALHNIFSRIENFLLTYKYNVTGEGNNHDKEIKTKFSTKVKSLVQPYICNEMKSFTVLDDLISQLYMLEIKEISSLAKTNYCLFNSPKLKMKPTFTLCHGKIPADDTLNQIYVSTDTEILTRAASIGRIIDKINKYQSPKICTICRSLRDGYTPRDQQTYIEKALLDEAAKAFGADGLNIKLIYDENLLFGKIGWK